eukprot:1448892-Prymnesium_polylepis.1
MRVAAEHYVESPLVSKAVVRRSSISGCPAVFLLVMGPLSVGMECAKKRRGNPKLGRVMT